MADELDPVLEARLRGALTAEADSIPFTLRADTVRRVGAERERAHRTQRLTVLAAAAVVLFAVAGLGLSFAMRSPLNVAASPTPASSGGLASPNLTGLPSFGQLAAAARATTDLGRQEGQADTQGGQWQVGVPKGTWTVEVVVACTGGNLNIGTMGADLPVKWLIGAQCNGQPVDLPGIGGGALGSDAAPSIAINATAGTAFRLIVRDEAGTVQDPSAYPAPTPDANGLATYDALKHELEFGGDVIASTTGEHPTSETGSELKTWDLGTLDANQGQIAMTCFGASMIVGFGDGKQLQNSIEERCDPIISVTSLPTNADSGVTPHLMVRALPSVRWRVVAGIVPATLEPTGSPAPSPTPSASVIAGLPGPDALLATLPAGAMQVGDASRGVADGDKTVVVANIAHRSSLAVVVACTGGGSYAVYQAGGAAGAEELGTMDCDGSVQPITWSGDGSQDAETVELHMGVGMTWAAIVADTSRVQHDPTASPLPSGQLPSVADIEASGANLGVSVASDQRTDGSIETTTAFGDVSKAGAVQVRLACVGSGAATVSVANRAGASDELGQAVCDGTVQSFTWIRSGGVADASVVWVQSPAGVTWSAVASDATVSLVTTTHPTPAVPCGKPDLTAKVPPRATLYQGTKAIGVIDAFTTSWSGGSSDGVPVVPDKAFGATSAPLSIRIAGDVCATSWSVRYGASGTPGTGWERVTQGVLADQPEPGADQNSTKNRENRIDVSGLPSGDWVVEVYLTFKQGDAAGVIRVHVP